MPDLLVKLYDLPAERPSLSSELTIRRVQAAETSALRAWIVQHFSQGWADEFDYAARQSPASALIAVENRQPVGFACYDVAAPGLFGPTGVAPSMRGQGVGAALLFAALDCMIDKGYVYAIIGWAGPSRFYEKRVGAMPIEGSQQRYEGKLVRPEEERKNA